MRRHHAAAILAAAVAALAPASAAGATETRSGTFRVELEGVQTTTWSTEHAAQFECDVTIDGMGSETVVFRAKPAVVDVQTVGRTVLIRRGREDATLGLLATIEREGYVNTTAGAICADGDGGGGAPTLSDCGTKRSKVGVELRYVSPRRGAIGLEPGLGVPVSTFANCPDAGTTWPFLLTRNGNGRPVSQVLPVDDLFAHGKNIVVARGSEKQDDGETESTTTIRWTLSFTRLDTKETK
jgi:hypothetical protein